MDQQTIADIKDAIGLLIGHRDPRFRDEAVFRLAELQALIYFPREPDFVDAARLVVGRVLLTSIEERTASAAPSFRAGSASQRFSTMLQNQDYAALFDSIFPEGVWTRTLRYGPSPGEFQKSLIDRRDRAEAVMHMLDYRYRIIHHKQGRARDASVSRSWVYSLKTRRSHPVSERTIKMWWSQLRDTATLIYVLGQFSSELLPDPIPTRPWLREMRKIARDRQALRRYFGMCAYVADQLSDNDQNTDFYPDEEILRRIPPVTKPLSEEERGQLRNYKADIEKFHLGKVAGAGR